MFGKTEATMNKLFENAEQRSAKYLNYLRDNLDILDLALNLKTKYEIIQGLAVPENKYGPVVIIGVLVDEVKEIGPLMRDLAKSGCRQTSKPKDCQYSDIRSYYCGKITIRVSFTGTVCKFVETGEEEYRPGSVSRKKKLVCKREK